MRVIAGACGGRRLPTAPRGVRPTADRVKEAVFSRLGSLVDQARVLDLFAGSGALGIEALSRGASHVCFVDRSPGSVAAVRSNLAALGLEAAAEVRKASAEGALRRLAREGECFDLVFLDPPYASGLAAPTLLRLVEGPLLAPSATVVLESAKRHPLAPVEGLQLRGERSYGDTRIHFLERAAAPA